MTPEFFSSQKVTFGHFFEKNVCPREWTDNFMLTPKFWALGSKGVKRSFGARITLVMIIHSILKWFYDFRIPLKWNYFFICYDNFKQTMHQKIMQKMLRNTIQFKGVMGPYFQFQLNKCNKNVWIINVPSVISRLDSVSDDFSWSYILENF